MILVQTLGTGCAACDKLVANARQAVEELGIDSRGEQVGDIDVILDLEVLAVPALAINRHVTANGRVPSVAEIKGWLPETGVTGEVSAPGKAMSLPR